MNEIDREIIVAALAGEATDEEERRLAEWRARDPANRRKFRRLVRLWKAAGDLGSSEAAPVPRARAIVEAAEARPARPATARVGGAPTRSGGWSGWKLGAMAACLVLGVGIGTLASGPGGDEEFGPRTLVTGINEVATTTLEDETVVRLAPGSRLEFSDEGSAREVFLRGRAYFAVSRRPDQPFRVRLPGGAVKVLGTRFDVESRDGDVQVAVVEGQVRVEAGGEATNVEASQVARAAARGDPLEVRRVDDIYQVIDWLGRFLAFESTPMIRVVEEMERRFGIRIRIRDRALRERTVTGWFPDQSSEEIMAGICRAVDARCTVRDGTVRMEPSSNRGRGSTATTDADRP